MYEITFRFIIVTNRTYTVESRVPVIRFPFVQRKNIWTIYVLITHVYAVYKVITITFLSVTLCYEDLFSTVKGTTFYTHEIIM